MWPVGPSEKGMQLQNASFMADANNIRTLIQRTDREEASLVKIKDTILCSYISYDFLLVFCYYYVLLSSFC